MIQLERYKDKKWIFQKNVSSTKLIEAYVKVLNETKDIDKSQIQDKLREQNAYTGRTLGGSLSTMGVRFSQMCFYMFGYKSSRDVFIPTQTTINLLHETNSKNKNMLVNLFSLQYPHPYSKTPKDFKIYAGRLIIKLLTEQRISKRLYMDEMIWFLPFIKSINSSSYDELIKSILEYRQLSFAEKQRLFESIDQYTEIFSNCLHEINYYFVRIFKGFEVLQTIVDYNHNGGKVFSFQHGETNTFRNDSCQSGREVPGYVQLNPELFDSALMLLDKYSPFDNPTSMDGKHVFSKEDWIADLYENEIIKYLDTIFPDYNKQREIITSLSTMTYMSKYSGVDGKDFENSLKPVFELFREVLNVEIISGSGDTDLLCAVENPLKNNEIYKVNVDGKSRKSSNNLNPVRIKRHIESNNSRYCIVVAPRFSKGTTLDIEGFPIVTLTAESLARYCSKECLSSKDSFADYIELDRIISDNLGKDVTRNVDNLTISKYGIHV